MSVTWDKIQTLMDEIAEYGEPPNKIFMRPETVYWLRQAFSRRRTKHNRARHKARRKAMGRGRW